MNQYNKIDFIYNSCSKEMDKMKDIKSQLNNFTNNNLTNYEECGNSVNQAFRSLKFAKFIHNREKNNEI
jgi:hypothetical protein